MEKTKAKSKKQNAPTAKNLAFSALFAALCAVSTLLITVPLPNGYFNTGDVFVLLSGWFLGPIYGCFAAATGSALADVISGYAVYAPATFVVKGLVALIAYTVYLLWKSIIKRERLDFLPRLFSAICGEIVMILGYFVYESVLFGIAGGAVSLLGNAMQGVCCLSCAVLLCSMLYPVKSLRKLFPLLK